MFSLWRRVRELASYRWPLERARGMVSELRLCSLYSTRDRAVCLTRKTAWACILM
jgi:hypothetical protein